MNNQCKCKLPYVLNGTNTCKICGDQQSMFLKLFLNELPITKATVFNGTEYQSGDIVQKISHSYCCLVEVERYLSKGWYRIKLPNGGFHETQRLGDKVIIEHYK